VIVALRELVITPAGVVKKIRKLFVVGSSGVAKQSTVNPDVLKAKLKGYWYWASQATLFQ